jgi:NADH pyrophosphatase NudC (nudix superfamily)
MDIGKAYKFCPRCGLEFGNDNKDSFLKCGSCGLNFYLNSKPCNGLLLKNEDGEYLLVERSIEPKKGYYDTPGGFVDPGETFEQSAHREIKEELGIKLDDLTYVGSYTDTYIFQEIEYPTLIVVFEAKLNKNTRLKANDDVASFEFFKLEDFPVERFAFPWMNKMHQDLLNLE